MDCPECRREYKIPPESGVKGFPENRLMKFHEKKKSVPKFFTSFSLKHSLSSSPTLASVYGSISLPPVEVLIMICHLIIQHWKKQ